jgi:HK97 family phage portal protein
MGFMDRVARGIDAPYRRASAGVPSYGMIPPLGSVQSASGLLISQGTAMTVSAVYACVRRIAADVARCTPSLYELNTDGSRKTITNHPIGKLFNSPNRQQTWFEWMEQTIVGYLLRGNGYAPIRRDDSGEVTELIPVNPDAVLVLEASDGSVFYNVNRLGLWQIAMLRDFPVAISSEDMFHLRGLTFNALVSVSTIGLGRDAVGLSMALEQQANRYIGNGARPATWLKTSKVLSEVVAKRLKAQFDDNHAGVQNVGKTVVLEEGLEPVALQLTSVDLEFIQQRNFSVLEICRFFGVPPHKVYADTGRQAAMNIPQQDQDYANSTVSQHLDRFEDRFRWTFGLDKEGIYLDLDESQLLRADILTRRNAARLGILSSVTTPDEERRAEGLPPMGGRAAELQYPTNTAATGSDITGTAPDGAGRPAGGKPPAPGVSTGGKGDETHDDDAAPSD